MLEPALNYHHLHYFWVVAHEGSISRAAVRLSTSKATISAQLRLLERQLGAPLFARTGRQLALTDTGRSVLGYADEIFATGRDLVESVRGKGGSQPLRLRVGVGDVLPKPIVRRLLEPVFHLPERVYVICREDRSIGEFIGELVGNALDVVLSDAPVGAGIKTSVHGHLLGECATAMFASPKLSESLKNERFPRNLDGAPWLLPGAGTDVRRGLERWMAGHSIRPVVIGEFDDNALMNLLGQDGLGIFPGPEVIAADVRSRYGVVQLGTARAVRQRYYAITEGRRLRHAAVRAICNAARTDVFV
ncbi:MAG: LysR family transcriptional regulator [Deltaproteobacteria bacterium]|nr:LysR family transcriptional regulator [Nannocystaceae bacterium]